MENHLYLETERTCLRKLTGKDAEHFFNLNLDQKVLKYTGNNAFQTIEDAKIFLEQYDQYQKYGVGRLAVIDKKSDSFIGWCGLKYTPELNEYDIGFRFLKDFWRKGFATETAQKCLEFGFKYLELDKIVGRAMVENKASVKVFEKIGMSFKKDIDFEGKPGVIYQITKKDLNKI